jgi:hypothetical protein
VKYGTAYGALQDPGVYLATNGKKIKNSLNSHHCLTEFRYFRRL